MIILRGGTLIDGTGAPGRRDDLAIDGDRIVAIGSVPHDAAEVLDVSGRVVAPGFIDVHNHSEGWLLKEPHALAKTRQGITTEVLMSDGISYAPLADDNARDWLYYLKTLDGLELSDYCGWRTIAEYLSLLDGRIAQNVIAEVPYANVRVAACGWRRCVPDDTQMRHMQHEIRQAMEQGACGVSTGLDYVNQFFATTDELVEACQAAAEHRGFYVTHVRYKKGLLPAIREAVEIGRRAGIGVHISHLKAPSRGDLDALLEYIDRVAMHEVDFTFDVYPYMPGSTMLSYYLPNEVWEDGPLGVLAKLTSVAVRRRLGAFFAGPHAPRLDQVHFAWLSSQSGKAWQGKTLADYVEFTGGDVADAVCDLLIEENLRVLMVAHLDDESLLEPLMKHERFMFGSDGIDQPGAVVHPRQFGGAAKMVGPLVRDRRWFSLEQAVQKMTSIAARRFGLQDRGVLKVGAFADVVVFDPATVGDRATFENPRQYAVGFDHVFVNGSAILRDGQPQPFADRWPGRALRYAPSA